MPPGLLNPALDTADLGRAYAVRKRLQIRDVLVPQEAERLHQMC